MDSQKSTPNTGEAKAPSRARGHARVASLLEAAGAEFALKGYEATTMTAIAARAKSSIGSLYQFFPTKEQVAGTLFEQYVTELEAVFGRLSEEARRCWSSSTWYSTTFRT
jgi:AcrR family transcriptional regulator